MNKNTRVGLLGIGLMGHGLGHNILAGGYELRIFGPNRNSGIEDLEQRGAKAMTSVRAVAEASDIVLCCLPSVAVISEVIGGADGVIENIANGGLIVDTSTSTPVLAAGFAERAAAKGVGFIDAALMKGPVQAMEGSLNIIAGGSEANIARAKPILDTFSSQFFHVGPVGAGCTVKLLNQAIGLGTHALVTEALVLGAKLGLDIEVLSNIISSGNSRSEKLTTLSEKFLSGDYSLKFATNTGIKDLRLCERMSVDAEGHTPILNTVIGLFETNAALGNSDKDVSTLAESVGKLTGIDFPELARKK